MSSVCRIILNRINKREFWIGNKCALNSSLKISSVVWFPIKAGQFAGQVNSQHSATKMRGIYICLLFAIVATIVATATADSNGKLEKFRLKDIYDKDGIAKGQRRYIGKRLNGNKEFNAALNRYINHKQEMLEQLRPIMEGCPPSTTAPTVTTTGPIFPTTPTGSPTTTGPFCGKSFCCILRTSCQAFLGYW